MAKITKSKIFWTNIVAALIAILGLLTPETLATFGFDNKHFLGTISLLAAIVTIVLRTLQTLPSEDTALKFGGRPRREKKPLSYYPSGYFLFNGTEIFVSDTVTYTQSGSEERELHISNLFADVNHQRVLFVESIEVPNLNDITFYFSS